MFKIGKHLSTEEYQTKIVPCIVKLFSSSDRNARFKLLTQIEHFVEHLSSKIGKYSLDFTDLTELCSVLLLNRSKPDLGQDFDILVLSKSMEFD